MSELHYVGSELELFAGVKNWKYYWSSLIRPFLKGDVLEVGAGIGANTELLHPGTAGRWVCIEPDPDLYKQLVEKLKSANPPLGCEPACGILDSMAGQQFDTILYIDVLEHIEQDREELKRAATYLRKGGNLIVLSPAHQYLYSPFDAGIGHFRRYSRDMLREISPPNMRIEQMRYADCAGLILSAANKLMLRQSLPTKAQLQVWDRYVIPVSRVLDGVFGYSLGKTVIGVWTKT